MQRYKANVEYCGTHYRGMQKQKDLKTIQGSLELAISQFTAGKTLEIDYCGRTDAGVHAFSQTVHFDLYTPMNETQICRGINFYLHKNNEEIAVKSCISVENEFHARFSCKSREYKYYIYNNPVRSPIFYEKMHHEARKLDVSKMQDIANILIGTHDFSSFRGRQCQALSPIKTVDFITVSQISADIVEIHIGAKSFLYKMVRNITGLLILAGNDTISKQKASEILEARDISKLYYTAPAEGLYFWKANY